MVLNGVILGLEGLSERGPRLGCRATMTQRRIELRQPGLNWLLTFQENKEWDPIPRLLLCRSRPPPSIELVAAVLQCRASDMQCNFRSFVRIALVKRPLCIFDGPRRPFQGLHQQVSIPLKLRGAVRFKQRFPTNQLPGICYLEAHRT